MTNFNIETICKVSRNCEGLTETPRKEDVAVLIKFCANFLVNRFTDYIYLCNLSIVFNALISLFVCLFFDSIG